jgi:predicted lipid-binding transport protein (Tim44 family)
MNYKFSRLVGVALVVVASLAWVVDAEARRMGGGRSLGRQSNITQGNAAPAQPAAAPRAPQNAQQSAAAGQGAAAAGSRSRWMAPLAGLAAGLGLAALASWLGFGEGLATIMLIALLAIAALFVFRMIMARRQGAGARPAMQGALAGAGAGAGPGNGMRYSPTPQERGASSFPQAGTGAPVRDAGVAGAGAAGLAGATAGTAPVASGNIPADFDVEAFLRTAKVQFVRLQSVYDAGDLNDLRDFTSPEMFAELKMEVAERGGRENRTDVVTLDASLLGVESGSIDHAASVRFTGMVREEVGGEAKPFDEVWVLAKPVSGPGGWVLAGIQQLS